MNAEVTACPFCGGFKLAKYVGGPMNQVYECQSRLCGKRFTVKVEER
jgi:transposase-like protein